MLPVVVVAAVLVVAAGAFLLVRQGDDEQSEEERQYADAMAARLDADDDIDVLSAEETRCVADGAVEAVGVETLQRSGTPDEIREGDSDSDGLEVDLTEEQGNAYYEAIDGCVDVRQLFLTSLEREGLPQEVIDCVEERIDDRLLRESVVADFAGDEEASDAASDALEEAVGPCQSPAG